mgnify:CR=1 FL=1
METKEVPILAFCMNEEKKFYYSIETSPNQSTIYQFEVEGKGKTKIGEYGNPIRHLFQKENYLISYSWDKTLSKWDLRVSNKMPAQTIKLDSEVSSLTQKNSILVGSYLDTPITDYSMLELGMDNFKQTKMKLKLQGYTTSPIHSFTINQDTSNHKCAFGTADGLLGFFNYRKTSEISIRSLIKLHKVQIIEGKDLTFPINAVEFHPTRDDILFSGGGDGNICFFDTEAQSIHKKIEGKMPVLGLKATISEDFLIIIRGNDWANRAKEYENGHVSVYRFDENDFP